MDVDFYVHYLAALVAFSIPISVGTVVLDPAAALVAKSIFVGIHTGVIDQHSAVVTPVVPILVHTAVGCDSAGEQTE